MTKHDNKSRLQTQTISTRKYDNDNHDKHIYLKNILTKKLFSKFRVYDEFCKYKNFK